nr:tetratricopeptide repeat protein [Bacteroides coprosuis]
MITMKRLGIFLSFMLCFMFAVSAEDSKQEAPVDSLQAIQQSSFESNLEISKAAGDTAYVREDYATAASIYEELLQKGVSAELYYNLGNSYYKIDNIAKAVLNYERAVLLSPNNRDYKANLAIASSKIVDKDESSPELFFITWGKTIVNWMTSDQWAVLAVSTFILCLVSLMIFFLSKKTALKKIGFVIAILTLITAPIFNYCSLYQKKKITNQDTAIVMEPSVTVRSTPSESGTSLFVIHEGKKVKITDNSMSSWKEIELENGEVGWLPTEAIEII